MFDPHDRALAILRGACTRGVHDSEASAATGRRSCRAKMAVEAVCAGKERLCNRHLLQMNSHYLVQPLACTPASGCQCKPPPMSSPASR